MIQTSRAVEFFGADYSESFKQFWTHEVHTAFSASGGKVGGTNTLSTGEPGEQRAVFIIRMGTRMKNAADDVQTFQHLRQPHGSAVFGNIRSGRHQGGSDGQKSDHGQQ